MTAQVTQRILAAADQSASLNCQKLISKTCLQNNPSQSEKAFAAQAGREENQPAPRGNPNTVFVPGKKETLQRQLHSTPYCQQLMKTQGCECSSPAKPFTATGLQSSKNRDMTCKKCQHNADLCYLAC